MATKTFFARSFRIYHPTTAKECGVGYRLFILPRHVTPTLEQDLKRIPEVTFNEVMGGWETAGNNVLKLRDVVQQHGFTFGGMESGLGF